MPDVDIDFDERRRGEVIRYVTEKWGEDKVAQIATFGTIKAKAAIKDSARVLGYPYAVGDRITKAMPPAVMGKDIPLAGIFDPKHPRYAEAGEIRGAVRGRGRRQEGRRHRPGHRGADPADRRARRRRHHVRRADHRRTSRLMRRDADGAIITQFDYPTCESLGLLKMDFLGLRNLTDHRRRGEEHRGQPRAASSTCWSCRWTTRPPTSCWPAATPWACSSSTAGRCARCCG